MNMLPGGKFLKPIMAGLIGGITEKFSQDQARVKAPLKRVKAKLKGRKQEKDVGQTIDLFDRMGDDSILSSMISSALSEAIIPLSKGAAPGELDTGLANIGQQVEGIQTAVPGARSLARKPSLSLNEEMLGGLVPGFDFEGAGSEFQGKKGQALLKLLKYLGPSVYQELFKPKPLIDSYAQPQFRNPYRGGY